MPVVFDPLLEVTREAGHKFTFECPVKHLVDYDRQWVERYLSGLVGPTEVHFLASLIKSWFKGGTPLRYLTIFTGAQGNNGKSYLLDLLQLIFGRVVMAPVEKSLLLASRSSNQAAWKTIQGPVRLARLSELKPEDALDSVNIKNITTGGVGQAKDHNGKLMEVNHNTNLVIDTNFIPVFDVSDQAMVNRIRVVRFPNKFPSDSSFKDRILFPRACDVFSYVMQTGDLWNDIPENDATVEWRESAMEPIAQAQEVRQRCLDSFLLEYELTDRVNDLVTLKDIRGWLETNYPEFATNKGADDFHKQIIKFAKEAGKHHVNKEKDNGDPIFTPKFNYKKDRAMQGIRKI